MATVKACAAGSGSIKNTGSECDSSLGPIKMLLMGDTSIKYTLSQIEDFVTTITAATHGNGKARVYPLFGNKNEMWETTNTAATAVTATSPDTGAIIFIRSGFETLTFGTTKGGLCLAQAFNAMGHASLGFIPIDADGTYIVKKNSDGTYGFFSTYSSPLSPVFAFGSTIYQNRFSISFNPDTFIQQGEIFTGAQALLDEQGLIDSDVVSRAAATATSATVGVVTECAGTDLYDTHGTDATGVGMRNPTSWVVTKVSDGSSITVTGVTVNAGLKAFVLAFATQTTGTVLSITLAPTATLFTNLVEGFEAITPVTVTIP